MSEPVPAIGEEVFGSPGQRAVLRRARALYAILQGDPRFSYYGRSVGIVSPEDADAATVVALARLQGNSSFAFVPDADVAALRDTVAAEGLAPMHYLGWEGRQAALDAARDALTSNTLPDDLTLERLDRKTPPEILASLAETALAAGVLPLYGDVLRGEITRSVCLVALDRSRRVVACAASSSIADPAHPRGGQAWWGMLATRPERRGQRLALILGAQAMVYMEERYGFRDFMTGVEPGNTASENVCRRMGLAPKGANVLAVADPVSLGSGRMTK